MAANTLIVPTLLLNGTIHFAEISQEGTAQDVVDTIVASKDITNDILGHLENRAWALQRIRVEKNGRNWEQDELEVLGDGKQMSRITDCRETDFLTRPSVTCCTCRTDFECCPSRILPAETFLVIPPDFTLAFSPSSLGFIASTIIYIIYVPTCARNTRRL